MTAVNNAQPLTHVRASLVQMDVEVLQPERNLARVMAAIKNEVEKGVDLIVFPELVNTGYIEPLTIGALHSTPVGEKGYAYALYQAAEAPCGNYTRALCEQARLHGLHIVIGLAMQHPLIEGALYNSSVLIGPQGMLGVYNKIHRWHMEKMYFIAGDALPVFSTPFGRMGMQVCYDIRFPEVTRAFALQGAGLVTNIWASLAETDKPPVSEEIFVHRAYTRATENGVFVLSCNRVGTQGHCHFLGQSIIVAPNGNVLARASSDQEQVIRAHLELSQVAEYRSYTGIFSDRREDIY
ncbi:carbon-nitrogen hydrolase family protein [Pantoea vagans]|uniref:carbon-nitrogen hydrolase family protein n=1 Tax=Pantoea vagans TaxID=470934 RepID=UPI0023AFA97C|nr:carbon-nitrogen hydrolase family protein [Pantoea vagans]MDE8559380.1 carbon-nitrogen hydrolase family protein [Pantoea vagans]MDE8579375.1 carbon-nitrogen hydrolase family protein [Pantoea vagans]